uniref:MADS-box domain-containing protein n=1 Tax=Leersia perrieri TaxID=77586 RepID=A0A0D9V107_9ORYZ
MPLRKVTIEPITNQVARRSTHERRTAGLLKKVQEVSILCNVRACIVVYNIGDDTEPKAWPSLPEATNILEDAMDITESSIGKRMLDTESLLRLNITEAEKKLRNKRAENCQLEINMIMNDVISGRRKNLDDLDPQLIGDIQMVLAMRHLAIRNRINVLRSKTAS